MKQSDTAIRLVAQDDLAHFLQESKRSSNLVPFHRICPKLAVAECRSIKFTGAAVADDLPPGEYHLFESYCTEKNCDCRRVMLNVTTEKRIEATISFGFDLDDPDRGPYLDPLNP